MCIYGGINGVDVPGQAEGRLTRDMVGDKLRLILGDTDWIYTGTDDSPLLDRLYPQLRALAEMNSGNPAFDELFRNASKVGASPIFLRDGREAEEEE
jgi:hypothetical protein